MNATNGPHGCNLCKEVTGAAAGAEFALLASYGALTVGHTLLCPARHVRSVAALPQPVADLVLKHVSDLAILLGDVTGEGVHVFEHGSAREGTRVACSVEHAHVHLLPADADINSALNAMGAWHPLQWSGSSLNALSAGREYLLYRDPNGLARLWVTEGEAIPSQLMRQLIANALGRGAEWNWREHPALERTAQTRALAHGMVDATALAITA
jgi:ATP adenylyltransferase